MTNYKIYINVGRCARDSNSRKKIKRTNERIYKHCGANTHTHTQTHSLAHSLAHSFSSQCLFIDFRSHLVIFLQTASYSVYYNLFYFISFYYYCPVVVVAVAVLTYVLVMFHFLCDSHIKCNRLNKQTLTYASDECVCVCVSVSIHELLSFVLACVRACMHVCVRMCLYK